MKDVGDVCEVSRGMWKGYRRVLGQEWEFGGFTSVSAAGRSSAGLLV